MWAKGQFFWDINNNSSYKIRDNELELNITIDFEDFNVPDIP
jgi:hypothetical protein